MALRTGTAAPALAGDENSGDAKAVDQPTGYQRTTRLRQIIGGHKQADLGRAQRQFGAD